MTFSPSVSRLIRTSDLLRAGHDDHSLRRAADRGELTRIVPGVFLPSSTWTGLDLRVQHLLRAEAIRPSVSDSSAFSHLTAAAFHGWASLQPWPNRPAVTDPVVARSRKGATRLVHASPLASSDTEWRYGYRVTEPGRTALDLATTLPFAEAVVSLDSALRDPQEHGPVVPGSDEADKTVLTLDQLDEASRRRGTIRAHRRFRTVRSFVDGRSGSPGESLSRVVLSERGWPPPVLQQPFVDRWGLIGYADFWWPQFGVIGEFDGYVKYSQGNYLKGAAPADAVVAEKRREDRLRALPEVRTVVRWMWSDVTRAERLDGLLAAAGVRKAR